MQSKAKHRHIIQQRFREYLSEELQKMSAQICAKIRALPEYQQAQHVMIYQPMQDEVDVSMLLEDDTKEFYLPEMVNNEIQVQRMEDQQIIRDLSMLDLILVPGRAFTQDGKRIGRGGGHYDRFLIRLLDTTPTIGVAFHFQLFEDVLQDKHDVRMQHVVTNTKPYETFNVV